MIFKEKKHKRYYMLYVKGPNQRNYYILYVKRPNQRNCVILKKCLFLLEYLRITAELVEQIFAKCFHLLLN